MVSPVTETNESAGGVDRESVTHVRGGSRLIRALERTPLLVSQKRLDKGYYEDE